jgi:hypothetical protein
MFVLGQEMFEIAVLFGFYCKIALLSVVVGVEGSIEFICLEASAADGGSNGFSFVGED